MSVFYSRMVSNDSASFSLEEIKAQLAALGYGDVGEERLEQFHSDISQLLSGKSSFKCPSLSLFKWMITRLTLSTTTMTYR